MTTSVIVEGVLELKSSEKVWCLTGIDLAQMAIKEIPDTSKWRIISSSVILDPKYAVKELLDNAIDAGATNIYIDVDARTSGCNYISARDDGSGVNAEDRALMCSKHSTSKISSLRDLSNLSSLGFRGQALFSLSNLANQKGSMQIITRTNNEKVGEKWLVDKNGHIKENTRKRTSCPSGTNVIIRNLLLGLRARYIQISSRAPKNNDEIHRLINHYALNFRSIRFHFYLVSVEKTGLVTKRQLQGSLGTNLSRVRALSAIAQLKNTASENFLVKNDLTVTNLVHLDVILPSKQSPSDIVSLKRVRKFLSVNNRAMSLRLNFGGSIKKIINKVYRSLNLPEPMAWYINLKCDTKLLDLNVEPGKDDVLIKDTELIMNGIEKCLFSYITDTVGDTEINNIDGFDAEGNDQSTVVRDVDVVRKSITQGYSLASSRPESHECLDYRAGNPTDQRPTDGITILSPQIDNMTVDSGGRNRKRTATSDLLNSDDNRWKRNLISDECINSQDSRGSDLPSSLTYNYETPQATDEDMVLAKDVSLSNPFMTAKLRKVDHKLNQKRDSNNMNSNFVKHTPNEEFSLKPKVQQRMGINDGIQAKKVISKKDLEDSECSSPNETTLVDDGSKDDRALITRERIDMFSESTQGLTITMRYNLDRAGKAEYKEELKWLARDEDPTQTISRSLMYFSGAFRNKQISLSRANDEWFKLTV